MVRMPDIPREPAKVILGGLPEGQDARTVIDLAASVSDVLFIARDDRRLAAMTMGIRFFSPDIELIEFPAWDCLPYDRIYPRTDIVSQRIDALNLLVEHAGHTADNPRIVLTTIAAILQRVAPRDEFRSISLELTTGGMLGRDELLAYLEDNVYSRVETVMEPGDYAVRGDIIDLFAPGRAEPLRIDFFGDEIEKVRTFEPFDQRSTGEVASINLKPIREIHLDENSIRRFRTNYRALFGAVSGSDLLYESISNGQTFPGMEHWLPLFHERLETLFNYVPDAAVVLDHQAEDGVDARFQLIDECYEARAGIEARGLALAETPYRPLPPDRLYLSGKEWKTLIDHRRVIQFHSFAVPTEQSSRFDAGGRPGREFADARVRQDLNIFDVLREHIEELQMAAKRVVIATHSTGSAERLRSILAEHGIKTPSAEYPDWPAVSALPADAVAIVVFSLERGFIANDLAVITEQDILGERLGGGTSRRRHGDNFLTEYSTLSEGDSVVHIDHGIGRYDGLMTLDVAGASHDCLSVSYDGGDKLFVPVENIEVLSRYGDEAEAVRLDRLGGAAWQSRRAKLKQRIRDMAERLIRVAAARTMTTAEKFLPPGAAYDEFCAGFPYVETEDQIRAIDDVIDDLARGQAMDRLICGDVGFGKTEVALRAAFTAAMEGKQVAVVVPTTLLARQHYQVFDQRFGGFPIQVRQLSRLIAVNEATATKAGLADGTVDIVVGTHALLAKSISFDRLGLLVVDEEQHFGVSHKERLKELKTDVHVLTLTATPIPRTLQLALTGVRDLSLITTPPVDRLAVRTFVMSYDPVVIREALMREHYRGGQSFYVCPRIADLASIEDELSKLVPELRLGVAHGKMSSTALEESMSAFYAGGFDVLLSTNIVESGLDLPSVNTIVIHRADRFGLAQLYQLRGRIGRAKVRGYAYLTLPPRQVLSSTAQKRLELMQALDSLGAGFMLASHDLDIRGAGNLLGEEQSGHIREVGIELYQQMLKDAVTEARQAADGNASTPEEIQWIPQIELGMPVLIPEKYVPDLGVRLNLYRRAADLSDKFALDSFAVELIDRFGQLPPEVENLLNVVGLKNLCRDAGVAKVEAGPKGAVISFHDDDFSNLVGLVEFITSQVGTAKLRPDQRMVLMRKWDTVEERFNGVRELLVGLAALAQQSAPESVAV